MVDACSSLMVLGAVSELLADCDGSGSLDRFAGNRGRWTALALLACGAGWYPVRVVLPVLFGRVNPLFAARTIEHSDPSLKNSRRTFCLLLLHVPESE